MVPFPDCQDAIDEFEENYEKNKKNSRRRKRKKSDTEFNPANIKIDTSIAVKTGNCNKCPSIRLVEIREGREYPKIYNFKNHSGVKVLASLVDF